MASPRQIEATVMLLRLWRWPAFVVVVCLTIVALLLPPTSGAGLGFLFAIWTVAFCIVPGIETFRRNFREGYVDPDA
jgi:hypothetical protein